MHIQGIDHVEFHVADADGMAADLCARFGFRVRGHATPPGQRRVLLRQGRIDVLLTEGTTPADPAAEYVRRHGDGVATIALATDEPGRAPLTAFGDVTHTFVEPGALAARMAAGPAAAPEPHVAHGPDLLTAIDHVAVCVPAGELAATVRRYEHALGFGRVFEEYLDIGGQAMNSQVVQSPDGSVTLTLLEPDPSRRPGQIDDFLAAHGGAGVQHVAFGTGDIATAVRTFAERGVGFLSTPAAYYEELERRLGHVGLPVATLRELNVLVDRDEAGELFQIFTQSTHPRRTFFFEVIERREARTFGSANIRALYQAVERDRARVSAVAGATG